MSDNQLHTRVLFSHHCNSSLVWRWNQSVPTIMCQYYYHISHRIWKMTKLLKNGSVSLTIRSKEGSSPWKPRSNAASHLSKIKNFERPLSCPYVILWNRCNTNDITGPNNVFKDERVIHLHNITQLKTTGFPLALTAPVRPCYLVQTECSSHRNPLPGSAGHQFSVQTCSCWLWGKHKHWIWSNTITQRQTR